MNNLKLHKWAEEFIVDHPSFLPSLSLKKLSSESTHCITGVEKLERTESQADATALKSKATTTKGLLPSSATLCWEENEHSRLISAWMYPGNNINALALFLSHSQLTSEIGLSYPKLY